MPRFYFQIRDRLGLTPDEVGIELNDPAQAYDYAIDSIRSIVADDARRGILSMGGFLDINDDAGFLIRVPYSQAFEAPIKEGHLGRAGADNDNMGMVPGRSGNIVVRR